MTDSKMTTLSIGPVDVGIFCKDEWVLATLHRKFQLFTTETDAKFKLHLMTQEGHIIQTEHKNAIISYKNNSIEAIRGDFQVTINPGTLKGSAKLLRGSEPGLDTILKLAFVTAGLKKNSFFLHAASSVFKDKGWIFPGVSGSGKTTILQKLSSHYALSDEMSLVAKIDGEWRVFGTPFSSITVKDMEILDAHINSIIFLRKGSHLGINRTTGSSGALRIMQSIIGWKLEIFKEQIMEFLAELVSENQFYELEFSKKHNLNEFWEKKLC